MKMPKPLCKSKYYCESTGQATRRGTNSLIECRLEAGIMEDPSEELTFNLTPDELERQRRE